MERIGFKEAKRRVLESLETGCYQAEARGNIEEKNMLASGAISEDDLCAIIEQCRGSDHTISAHHTKPDVDVHILRKSGWYVKFFFLDEEPDTFFISVHR